MTDSDAITWGSNMFWILCGLILWSTLMFQLGKRSGKSQSNNEWEQYLGRIAFSISMTNILRTFIFDLSHKMDKDTIHRIYSFKRGIKQSDPLPTNEVDNG